MRTVGSGGVSQAALTQGIPRPGPRPGNNPYSSTSVSLSPGAPGAFLPARQPIMGRPRRGGQRPGPDRDPAAIHTAQRVRGHRAPGREFPGLGRVRARGPSSTNAVKEDGLKRSSLSFTIASFGSNAMSEPDLEALQPLPFAAKRGRALREALTRFRLLKLRKRFRSRFR